MNDKNINISISILESTCTLQICRVCLVTDQQLYDMNMYNLSPYYNQLTGMELTNDEEYPQMLCWECVHRLKNWLRFRKKALRSHELMTDVLDDAGMLTLQNLSKLDREKNSLKSKLAVHSIDKQMVLEVQFESYFKNKKRNVDEKSIVDPLSYFADVDDVASSTVSDDDETLDHYKDTMKLEPDVTTGNDKLGKFKTEIKLETELMVKHETPDIEPVSLIDEGTNRKVFVKSESFHPLTNIFEPPNLVLVDAKVEENIVDFGKPKRTTRNSLKKSKVTKTTKNKVNNSKKISKVPVMKKNIVVKKAPVKTKKEKAVNETDFDKTLIDVVKVSVQEAISLVEQRKDSENFKDADFKCMECFKGFYDRDVYDTHMVYHSVKRGEFQCQICKVRCPTKLSLKRHLDNHLYNYSCKQCGFTTKSRVGAKKHADYHKKGTVYKCPHCDQKFEKHTSYLGHLRIKHPSDIICVLCGYSFVSIKGLEYHKKIKHRFDDREVKEDDPLCDECNMRFVSEEALLTHYQERHNIALSDREQIDKGGRISGKMDKTRIQDKIRIKGLKKYQRKKKMKYPVKCEQCGIELTTMRAYHWHFKKEHPDKTRTQYLTGVTRYMCEVCGRFFLSSEILEDHKMKHIDSKMFKCDRCGKAFDTNLSLNVHLKIHDSKRKKFACSVCGMTFTRSDNLKRHEYRHTGAKPYPCNLCDKSYATNCERTAHIEHTHFKKPWPKRKTKEHTDTRRRQKMSSTSTGVMPHQWATGSESNEDEEHEVPVMYLYV